jgi:hypothetical protein
MLTQEQHRNLLEPSNQLLGGIQYGAAQYITWSRNMQILHILKQTSDEEVCYSGSEREIDASDSDDRVSSVIKEIRFF